MHTLQSHYITHTLLYLPSFCDPPCVCITDSFRGSGAFNGVGIVGIHYVVTRKGFISVDMDTDRMRGQEFLLLTDITVNLLFLWIISPRTLILFTYTTYILV